MANVSNGSDDIGRTPSGGERAARGEDTPGRGAGSREGEPGRRETYRHEGDFGRLHGRDEQSGRSSWRGEDRGRSLEHRAATSVQHGGELSGWERWATLIGGGLLVRWGLRQGGASGLIGLALGGVMAWAGANGRLPMGAGSLGSNRQEGDLARRKGWSSAAATATSVTINKPAEELYRFWRNFSNLPQVMEHIETIEVLDDKRSRWTVKGPAGSTVTWEAIVTDDQPNRRIAWESAADADVRNAGWVEFQPAPGDRGTEVKALIVYEPPGGQIGRWVAKLFREEPGAQMRDDLRRFKQVMETGTGGGTGTTAQRRPL